MWNDLYTTEKLAGVLEDHADTLARLLGDYSLADDLRKGAECIRELAERAGTDRTERRGPSRAEVLARAHEHHTTTETH